LLNDLLVEHQVRHRLLQATVLLFKLLQPLDLAVPHAAELLPPAVQRLLADLQLLADLRQRLALRLQRLSLTQLSNHLVRAVPLPFHREPPGYLVPEKLSLRLDEVFEGRSPDSRHRRESPEPIRGSSGLSQQVVRILGSRPQASRTAPGPISPHSS